MTHSSSYLKLYAALLMLLVVGCTQTESHQSIERAVIPDADPSVLLMPPDILLQELTASGLTITNAAWTESGANNVSQALNISM